MSGKKVVSSARASEAREKATDKLDVKEFRDRFCIPNGVSEIVNEEVSFSRESQGNAIIFQKSISTLGSGFLCQLFKEFLHFSRFHPLHSSQHHMFTHALPSIGDGAARFDKGRGEGTRGGPRWMGGAIGVSVEALLSKLHLKDSGKGHLVDWVEKASFACVSKLFEIDAKERHYKTLLSARNLMAVVRESQDYVVNILPRKLPKEVVPGEHYTVKELPIYQEAKEADAEKRRALLEDREKRKNEGTIRKAPGQKRGAASPPKKAPAKKRKLVKKNGKGVKEPPPPKEFPPPPITHEADVIIEEPVNAAPHSISSGPGHVAGLNHSSTSLAAVARLANVAEEAASINHPGNPNPDVDASRCQRPTEEAGKPSRPPTIRTVALVPVKGLPLKRPRSMRNRDPDSSDGFKIAIKRLKLVTHLPTPSEGAKWRWQLRLQPSRW
ncbi:hypothetical protein AAG906_007378 [Vitis piasezkii]